VFFSLTFDDNKKILFLLIMQNTTQDLQLKLLLAILTVYRSRPVVN